MHDRDHGEVSKQLLSRGYAISSLYGHYAKKDNAHNCY